MAKIGTAPAEYNHGEFELILAEIQRQLDIINTPANQRLKDDTDSGYEASNIVEKREFDDKATLSDVINVLGTLVSDLRDKGVIE